MSKRLADIEGGPEFIERCAGAVREMALAFVGEPDAKVLAHLEQERKNFTSDLAAEIGTEAAAVVVDAMIGAVIGHKHELEAKGGSRA